MGRASGGCPTHEVSLRPTSRIARMQHGHSTPPAEAPHELHRVDGLVRMVLWGVMLVSLVQQISANGTATPNTYILALIVLLGALTGYLLLSIPSVVHAIRQSSHDSALLIAIVPLVSIVPYALYARQDPEFDPSVLLSTAMLLFLPVACALLNTASLKRGDIVTGLVTVMLPLAAPLIRNEPISMLDGIMRLGAFALPVLLLLLSTREQKQRLNFLFICAVFSLWYSAQFHALPDYVVPNTDNLQYFDVVLLPLLVLVLALANRFTPLGLSFRPTWQGAGAVLLHVALAGVLLVPLGLITGVLQFDPAPLQLTLNAGASSIGPVLLKLLNIYLFIALPEELLFRGTLLTYLRDVLAWPIGQALVVSSLIFGLAHLNHYLDVSLSVSEISVPGTMWVVILAALAGGVYALAFVTRKNVAAAAAVHALVNWIGSLLFHY